MAHLQLLNLQEQEHTQVNMAHFAKLDTDNIVTEIVVIENAVIRDHLGDEQESIGISFIRNLYDEPNAVWKQCSYNHNIRGHYPDIGWTYDEDDDQFYPPKPYDSWVWNNDRYCWDSPIGDPTDERVTWNEETGDWE